MLKISNKVSIPEAEIDVSAIRAQGSGGQHVNKVSSAIHLRFDSQASSLPDTYKQAILALRDRRVSREGVVVIKAQRFRSQDRNREDALQRLAELVRGAYRPGKTRVPTKPSRSSQKRRMDSKTRRSQTKNLRGKVDV